jgi:signal transduction histidine kinase
MKLTYRIVLLFTWIVTCILLVMAFILYNVSHNSIQDDFRIRLRNKALSVSNIYVRLSPDTANLMRTVDAGTPTTITHKSIYIFSRDLQPVYHFQDDSLSTVEPDTSWLQRAKQEGEFFQTAGQKQFFILHRIKPADFYVLVAAENTTGEEYLKNLRNVFFFYLPFALLVTLAAGYIFSRQLIKPIKETIEDVNLISTQNLSHRLFVGNNKDELSELNRTFNDLLDRLEESFDIQRRFISNASHELSTPLTSISSQLEVVLLQNRNEEEYRRVISSVMEDVKDLHLLTKSLLEIAKAGTHGAIELNMVRVDEVIMKAHSDVLKQNTGFKADLQFENFPEEEDACIVYGNQLLLYSAFRNIMENACKYSPDHSASARLSFTKDTVIFSCTNKGEIPNEQELQFLFEPFFRGKNSVNKPGFGLGLTLSQRIIRLHKGDIKFSSDINAGTTVTINLPVYR